MCDRGKGSWLTRTPDPVHIDGAALGKHSGFGCLSISVTLRVCDSPLGDVPRCPGLCEALTCCALEGGLANHKTCRRGPAHESSLERHPHLAGWQQAALIHTLWAPTGLSGPYAAMRRRTRDLLPPALGGPTRPASVFPRAPMPLILWKCHSRAGNKPLTCKLPHPESKKTE